MQLLNWLQNNVDQLIAAGNITVSLFMIVLGTIVIQFVYKNAFSHLTDIRIMLIGLATLCIGIASNRIFWATKDISSILNFGVLNEFMTTNAYLSVIPMVFTIIGTTLMVSPALAIYIRPRYKWGCYFTVMAFSICLYLSAFFKLKQLQYQQLFGQ